jgi:hypothetical protein
LEQIIQQVKSQQGGIVGTSLVCSMAENHHVPAKLIYSKEAIAEAVLDAFELD